MEGGKRRGRRREGKGREGRKMDVESKRRASLARKKDMETWKSLRCACGYTGFSVRPEAWR